MLVFLIASLLTLWAALGQPILTAFVVSELALSWAISPFMETVLLGIVGRLLLALLWYAGLSTAKTLAPLNGGARAARGRIAGAAPAR